MRFIVLSECVFYRLSVYTHRLYSGRFLYSTFGLGFYFDVLVLRFLLFIHHGSFIERYKTSKLGVEICFVLFTGCQYFHFLYE